MPGLLSKLRAADASGNLGSEFPPRAKSEKEPNLKYVRIDTFNVSNSFYYLDIQNPFQTSVRS